MTLSIISVIKMANINSPDPANALVPSGGQEEEEPNPVAAAPEPKLPSRKDTSLKEFLSKMDDYAPIVSKVPKLHIPPVTLSYLTKSNTRIEDP